MWGWIAVVFIGGYNYDTLFQYFMFATYNEKENKSNELQKDLVVSKMQSINHCIFYLNLLVSAPAIAAIVHLTLGWAEYSTIINTTLLISTMFAVDGFSAEMVNYWSYHKNTHTHASQMSASNESAVFAKSAYTHDLDVPLGLIRLTTFTVNATLGILFVTLAYPVSSDYKDSDSAVFVIFVLAFVVMLLIPDLLREFTRRISFNSTKFRIYGEVLVRTLVVFVVWRASANGRI